MSEYSRYIQTYDLAEKAGDEAGMAAAIEKMEQFEDRHRRRKIELEAFEPGLGDALRAGAEGATLGFWDELRGLASSDPYEVARDRERQALDLYREKAPLASLGAELAGGLAIPGLGALRTVGTMIRSGRSALPALMSVGAAEGALAGLGGSEAETAKGMARDAFIGSLIGTGAGAATRGAQVAAAGAGRRASEALTRHYLQGRTPEEIADEVRRLGTGATVAETGPGMRGFMGAAYRSRPENMQDYGDWILRRTRGQAEDIASAVEDVSGVREMPAQAARRLSEERTAEGNRLFGRVRGERVEVTEDMRLQLELPMGRGAANNALNVLRQSRRDPNLELDDVVDSLDFWHEWQQAMRGRAQGQQNRYLAGATGSSRQAALDEITPQPGVSGTMGADYQAARTAWREAMETEEAMAAGEKFLNMPRDVLAEELRGMSPEVQHGMILGAMGTIIRMAGQKPDTANAARQLVKSFDLREKFRMLLGDERADRLMERMEPIIEKNLTYQEIFTGSPTAERLSAQQIANAGHLPIIDTMRQLAQGNVAEAITAARPRGDIPVMDPRVASDALNLGMMTDPSTIANAINAMRTATTGAGYRFAPVVMGAGLSVGL